MSRLVCVGLGLSLLCGSACAPPRVRVVPDPNHLALRLPAVDDRFIGTYRMDSDFLGAPSKGHTVTIKKDDTGQYLVAERKRIEGDRAVLEGIGIGIADGDTLAMAWSSTERENDFLKYRNRPGGLEFAVFDFSGARFEAAQMCSELLTGILENNAGVAQPKPSAMVAGQSAEYLFASVFAMRGLEQIKSTGFQSRDLKDQWLAVLQTRRENDRFDLDSRLLDKGQVVCNKSHITGMLEGDRLYAATRHILDNWRGGRFGMSVLKREGDTLVGKQVWRHMVTHWQGQEIHDITEGSKATELRLTSAQR